MSPTHPQLVAMLIKSGEDIKEELTPKQAHLLHMAVGVAGESGELLDAVKRHCIYQKALDLPNVIEELGDLEFYMEGIRAVLNISREECLDANVDKLRIRYDGRYSNQAAQERKDKQ